MGHPVEFAALGYHGMASYNYKTVPDYHDTVISLDREDDEISTAQLGTPSTE